MIIPTYGAFRSIFAVAPVSAAVTVTFTQSAPGTPATCVRAAGSWVTSAFEVGMTLHVAGSVSNDGHYLITSVTATTLEIRQSQNFVNEGPIALTVTANFIDPSGYEGFPDELVTLVEGIAGFQVPYINASQYITLRASDVLDAIGGVDEWDWYLSQRSDVLSAQVFELLAYPAEGSASYSGRVRLRLRTEEAFVGVASGANLLPDDVVRIYKHCALYARNRLSREIAVLDLYEAAILN